MTDFYVDVDALTELSNQLRQIQTSLQQAPSSPDTYGGRLGSQKMEGALGDFINGWKDGRKKILDAIGGMLSQTQEAIKTYQQQEQALSGAGNPKT